MKMRILLIVCFILLLPAIVSCQMLKNRKPQLAGFGGYCSNCLVKNLDEDVEKLQNAIQESNSKLVKYQAVKTPVPVRFATVFNKDGKPVCRVDLLNYPELMPNFAKPSVDKTTYQASKSKRGLASVEEDSELPPCTDKYLNQLKQIAKNNVVINSDKSPIHKTSWKRDLSIGGVACVLGIGSHVAVNEYGKEKRIPPKSRPPVPESDAVAAGAASGLTAVLQNHYQGKYAQIRKIIREKGGNIKSLGKAENKVLISFAASVGTFCYFGREMAMVLYENITY